VAYHEASHCAAYLHLGHRFVGVSIVPHGTDWGRIEPAPAPPMPASVQFVLDRATIALAGDLGDNRHCGRLAPTEGRHVDDDLARAANLAALLTSTDAELGALMQQLKARAQRILQTPDVWHGVEAIAARLLLRRQLTHAQTVEAWQQAGPHATVPPL
jgi:hypothetical protein